MHDVRELMKEHYIKYASYVILDRAIPSLVDGLKPVQRRILYTLFRMQDGKFHKVANVAGQTMALHPHGDAPIYEALVALANKGYLLDRQGNFGNPSTGDPAAAGRYIETRLSKFALEVCFHPKITQMIPSYDGRHEEPVELPIKVPLLLIQGCEGIAVGMSTKILPHNLKEVLEAEIAILRGEERLVMPDFPTGGICDASQYQGGQGKVRVRAKIEMKHQKTLVIRELPFGVTTEALIASVEEAARKGKIKIDAIHDYTAQDVEIEIHLPRGVYAEEVEAQLYAFTECEVSLSPMMVVIKDERPEIITVQEALQFHAERLKTYLRKELELELAGIRQKIFLRTLEQLFIEEKIYKKIEEVAEYEQVFPLLEAAFQPFVEVLGKAPGKEEFELLLSIPIRRIAKFDRTKNLKERESLQKEEKGVSHSLKNVTQYTIRFLENLVKEYGDLFPRRTEISNLTEVDKRQIETKEIEVGYDLSSGYVGTKVFTAARCSCTNFDKILIFYDDGTYKVIPVDEKEYVGKPNVRIVLIGKADKTTEFVCLYLDADSGHGYCKRFIVKQFILNKEYRFLEEGQKLVVITERRYEYLVQLVPKQRQRVSALKFDPSSVLVKNVSAHGVRISPRPCLSIEPIKSE